MAVGHCRQQSTNPFETPDSEVSYVNPFDDDDDVLEVSSTQVPSSASVPREVNREGRYGSSSCEGEDGEELIPVKVERKLPLSQRLTPGSGETPIGHRNTISLDGATSCGRLDFDKDDDEDGCKSKLLPSSNSRQVPAPSRDRDLVSTASVGSFNGQRGLLFRGGSTRSTLEAELPRDENDALENFETYVQKKPKETSEVIANCLRVVEETKEAAGRTIHMLHCQGEQIHCIHESAVTLDRHLSVGEKILGSLGGIFSMKWKPKIARSIFGPVHCNEDSKNVQNLAERAALGLGSGSMKAMDKERQPLMEDDEALSDLSNVIGQLKDMSLLMNSEISKQTEGLAYLEDDVEELNARVKGANVRGRLLLRR